MIRSDVTLGWIYHVHISLLYVIAGCCSKRHLSTVTSYHPKVKSWETNTHQCTWMTVSLTQTRWLHITHTSSQNLQIATEIYDNNSRKARPLLTLSHDGLPHSVGTPRPRSAPLFVCHAQLPIEPEDLGVRTLNSRMELVGRFCEHSTVWECPNKLSQHSSSVHWEFRVRHQPTVLKITGGFKDQ